MQTPTQPTAPQDPQPAAPQTSAQPATPQASAQSQVQQPSTCPYCNQMSVTTVPYEETILFRGAPVHLHATMEHCSNPYCIEPDRLTYEQMVERDRQIKEQVAAWEQQHQEQDLQPQPQQRPQQSHQQPAPQHQPQSHPQQSTPQNQQPIEQQQPSKCPYCGQTSITTVPYEETILFRGIPVHQSGTIEHCSNPRCIEPDRFTYEQMSELDRQIEEQVATWKQQHQG